MVTAAELAVIGTITGSIIGVGGGIAQSYLRERNENRRLWSQLLFEKKHGAFVELLDQYKQTGQALVSHQTPSEIVDGTTEITDDEYQAIFENYENLMDAWITAKVLIRDDAREQNIRRGLNMFDTLVRMTAEARGFNTPNTRIVYDSTLEIESNDDFARISNTTQDLIRQEIMEPIEPFQK